MTNRPHAGTLGPLVHLVAATTGTDPTDGDLLGRFVTQRDEAAFATLVRRHGPMVLGVCRRLLSNGPDAEDAFQATFLILALKAATVSPAERVCNWLYGVARTTALKARRANRRRAGHERAVAVLPEAASVPRDDRWYDLVPILDGELSRLPDRYRTILVLCDLEGLTRTEAARRLGLPEGTVNSRLSRARAILAKRLTRHGAALSIGALVATLTRNAVACVPVSLANSTVKIAFLTATGGAVATGAVSANVTALTQGMGSAMLATKFKVVAAVALLLGSLGVTYALAVGRTEGTDPNDRRGSVVNEKEQGKPTAPPAPGTTDTPTEQPTDDGKEKNADLIRGVVQEVDGDSSILVSGQRVILTEKTEYLRETGFDAAPAKRSDVHVGMQVYIGTRKGLDGQRVATVVVIELVQPPEPKDVGGNKDKAKDAADDKTRTIHGVVKEVDGDSILLVGGEQVTLTEKTKYLRETGDDPRPAKISDVTKGTRVYIVTEKQEDKLAARLVVIEWIQPSKSNGEKGQAANKTGSPLPPPLDLTEADNGKTVEVVVGQQIVVGIKFPPPDERIGSGSQSVGPGITINPEGPVDSLSTKGDKATVARLKKKVDVSEETPLSVTVFRAAKEGKCTLTVSVAAPGPGQVRTAEVKVTVNVKAAPRAPVVGDGGEKKEDGAGGGKADYIDRTPSDRLVWYRLEGTAVRYFVLADGRVYPGVIRDGKYVVWHRAEPLLVSEYPFGGPQSRLPLIETRKIDYQTEPLPKGLERVTTAKDK